MSALVYDFVHDVLTLKFPEWAKRGRPRPSGWTSCGAFSRSPGR